MARRSAAVRAEPLDLESYTLQAITDCFDQFEKDLGGRPALLNAILAAPEHGEYSRLLGLLADPKSDNRKLSEIMKEAGVGFGQLLQAIKSSGFARAYVRTIGIIAEKVPAVVDDVITRAAPHYVLCAGCNNQPQDPVCATCKGTGRTLVLPEIRRQELALDLARMLPKQSPLAIIEAPRSMGTGTVEAMTDLIKATDDLLRTAAPRPASSLLPAPIPTPGSDTIDATVVESRANEPD